MCGQMGIHIYSTHELCSLNRGVGLCKPTRDVRKRLFTFHLWAPPRDRLLQLTTMRTVEHRAPFGQKSVQFRDPDLERTTTTSTQSTCSDKIPVVITRRRPCISRRQCEPHRAYQRTLVPVSSVTRQSGHTNINSNFSPTIYLLNPTSLAKPNAIEQLSADVLSYDADIIIIAETWLKKSHTDDMFNIRGYQIFRRDRPKRRGGGVAIYVKDCFVADICKESTTADERIELLWVKMSINSMTVLVGALYHPPKPIYKPSDLLCELDSVLSRSLASLNDTLVILGGDFNQLPNDSITRLGLQPLFFGATHAGHSLDRVYSSVPLDSYSKAVLSTISTSHKAVIISPRNNIKDLHKVKTQHQYRRRTPNQHAALLSCLQELSWDDVTQTPDVQSAFNRFYEKALFLLDHFYPLHQITVTNRDPSFVTPCIKGLLRRRNKLMRKGAVLAADSLSKRIGTIISEHNHRTFSHTQRGTKELWEQVRKVTGRDDHRQNALKQVTVEQLNKHFATISTDPDYKSPQPKSTAAIPQHLFTEYRVFCMLDTLKPTAMGLDGLPEWFLRLAAPAFASPITYLFNLSADTAIVPTQWKSSRIRPVPKVSQPQVCQDYRPISITPILSRIMEKTMVKSLLYPILTDTDNSTLFSDQFAFRPSGSTTSAIIYLLHQITQFLQEHEYVHLIALDFSKAFDTVRHHTLISKLSHFPLPDCFHNWLIDFLHSRMHRTKVGQSQSTFLPINASIIQGSGLGPVCFIFNASDLHPTNPLNILFKYADDTYLIIPKTNSALIPREMDNISRWAECNNLKLNTSKSLEMVIHLPTRKQPAIPPPICGITRVKTITVLGITFTDTLSLAPHVSSLCAKVARSQYAIKTLRAHGLHGKPLQDVTQATMVAQLLYASQSWWGYIGQEDKNKLESLLTKAKRHGFLSVKCSKLVEMVSDLDESLFNNILRDPSHVLHQILPPTKHTSYNLRQRSHSLTLPDLHSNQERKNFMYRMLYKDIY